MPPNILNTPRRDRSRWMATVIDGRLGGRTRRNRPDVCQAAAWPGGTFPDRAADILNYVSPGIQELNRLNPLYTAASAKHQNCHSSAEIVDKYRIVLQILHITIPETRKKLKRKKTVSKCTGAQLRIQISQGSVATDMRWGDGVCFCLVRCLSLSAKVKELWKSDHICQSYRKNRSGFVFSGTRCG